MKIQACNLIFMLKLRNVKIRHKLTAIIMLTSVIALSIVLTAFIIWEYFNAKTKMVSDYFTHIAIIADNSKAAVAFKALNLPGTNKAMFLKLIPL